MEFSWEDIFTCKFYKFMSVITLPDSNAKYSNPRAKNVTWIVIDFSTLKPLLSKKKKKKMLKVKKENTLLKCGMSLTATSKQLQLKQWQSIVNVVSSLLKEIGE